MPEPSIAPRDEVASMLFVEGPSVIHNRSRSACTFLWLTSATQVRATVSPAMRAFLRPSSGEVNEPASSVEQPAESNARSTVEQPAQTFATIEALT